MVPQSAQPQTGVSKERALDQATAYVASNEAQATSLSGHVWDMSSGAPSLRASPHHVYATPQTGK